MKNETYLVEPKRIITSAKFGISVYPRETYKAEVDSSNKNRYLVHVDDIVRLLVSKKDLYIFEGGI